MKHFLLIMAFAGALSFGENIAYAQEKTGSESEMLLETVGATSSASLYLGYLSLAAVRDNLETQQYDPKQIEMLIGSIVETIAMVNEQFRNMKKLSSLSATDSSLVNDMSEISTLLQEEASWLKRYTVTQSKMDLDKFEEIQQQAWDKLKMLFGNEEEKQ